MPDLTPDHHLSAEQLQAHLDGALPAGAGGAARRHLDGCARCRAELAGWEALFGELDALPPLAPSAGFQRRVLAAAPAPDRAAAPGRGHLDAGTLQDHLEGELAPRLVAAVEAHLDRCAPCRREMAAFRGVALALDGAGHRDPGADFRERVLASWRVEELARVAMAPTTRAGRLAARLRGLLPSSRQGWAVAGGLATVPAVVAALVLRAVFASPLLTVGNLLAFLRLRVADALTSLLASGSGLLQTSAVGPWLGAIAEGLSSPAVAAATAALVSGSTLAAAWVVYRFMIASQPADRPYATSR